MGGGSLMTPILVIVFGFKPTLRGRHGHPPRRDLQELRRRPAPAARDGEGAARALDVPRLGADVAARRRGCERALETATATASNGRRATRSAPRSSRARSGSSSRSFVHTKERPPDCGVPARPRAARSRRSSSAPSFGFVVGLTSVGSGTFFGLMMVIVFPLSASAIVGTDIFHAAALLWVAGFGHLVSRQRRPARDGWLLVGSIPGRADHEPVHAADARTTCCGSRSRRCCS